ncbi:MAG: DUF4355 domain-containing protein [Candidatus Methanomethylophilaceae archaeon]|nr:DUF4355 domain-containing protein [Candidatus Methanomethylophilaceae archaeon]MBR1452705.1 DUF4355 domain-containing protein [Candidatus Methanomethylophilaceae archaeon]
MVNDDDNKAPEDTGGAPPADDQLKFTQADLDRILKERLDKADRVHKRELSEMETKHKTEIERMNMDASERAKAEAEDERNALLKRAEEAENALRLTRTEKELANAGLPIDLAAILLNGAKDEKDIAKAVKLLSDASQERGNKLYAEKVGGRGAPSAPKSDESDDTYQQMRKIAGLK